MSWRAWVADWLDLVRQSPFGRLLKVQLLFCMVPGLAMTAMLLNSNIKRLGSIVLVHQAGDSWVPIGNALNFVRNHADTTNLYAVTYFNAKDQFIYAPQGLALFDLLDRVLYFSFGDLDQARIASWWLLPAMTALGWHFLREVAVVCGIRARDAREQLLLLGVAVCSVYLFFPLTAGYAVGNIQNFLTFIVALALLAHMRGRDLLAGVLFGVAVLVKPHIGLMVVWALLRRNLGFVAGVVVAGILGSAASLLLYGWPAHGAYLDLLHYLSGRGESYAGSHTFESLIYRALHLGNNTYFDPYHRTLQPVAWVHQLAVVLGIVTVAWAFWRREAGGYLVRMLDFGTAYLAIVITSPVAYEHHFGLAYLLLPASLMIGLAAAPADGRLRWALPASYLLLAGMFPVTDRLADTGFNFLQSYRLFGALLLMACMVRLRAVAAELERTTPAWAPSTTPLPA